MSMPAALARRLAYRGPALFSYGFRPFFLGGAIWSALALVLWILQYAGGLSPRTAFAPLDWHVHEMVFGYVAAIVAGFLLTAIPNWTGRMPICGARLAALWGLWLAGRVAMLFSSHIGLAAAAVVDVSFLATLAALAAREIIAGRNWRNLRVLALVGRRNRPDDARSHDPRKPRAHRSGSRSVRRHASDLRSCHLRRGAAHRGSLRRLDDPDLSRQLRLGRRLRRLRSSLRPAIGATPAGLGRASMKAPCVAQAILT
jgi:NnrS protein